jgi:DoxX
MTRHAFARPRWQDHLLALLAWLERFPLAILQLLFRISIAAVFWNSGLTKLASWQTTVVLFRDEYKVPMLPPELAATLAASVELTCPVLLVLGLATRLATLPMLGMTFVIEAFARPRLNRNGSCATHSEKTDGGRRPICGNRMAGSRRPSGRRWVVISSAGENLPAAQDDIDIEGIELEPVAAPAHALGRHQTRAAAKEGVKDNVAAPRAVEDRVGDHRDGFDCRMQGREVTFFPGAAKSWTGGIGPNIGAVAAITTKLNIVAMGLAPRLEDEDELVLRSVEAPHPAIGLRPDTEIDHLETVGPGGGE